uniref:Uncharacterized protein n=1 Tax=candidate division WOR-3 bacterium TaxID=2052148 RepID=A0A7V4E2C6_UNCW3
MIEKIEKVEGMTFITTPIKLVFNIAGFIGGLYGLFFILDIIYENLGSEYRPTDEFRKFLGSIVRNIKEVVSVKGI